MSDINYDYVGLFDLFNRTRITRNQEEQRSLRQIALEVQKMWHPTYSRTGANPDQKSHEVSLSSRDSYKKARKFLNEAKQRIGCDTSIPASLLEELKEKSEKKVNRLRSVNFRKL